VAHASKARITASALLIGALATACSKTEPRSGPVASSSASATRADAAHPPPFEKFELAPWKSPREKIAPVAPPGSLLETWRVFVNQERPRQKKNPRWISLPPREGVTLPMAEDGRFRCIVNPLRVQARPNDDLSGVDAWVLMRSVLCSGDGWRTWTDSPHQVVVLPDGKRTATIEQTDVLLREPIDGKVRETTIILRSDADPDPPRGAHVE
jgi:hypothetical protein